MSISSGSQSSFQGADIIHPRFGAMEPRGFTRRYSNGRSKRFLPKSHRKVPFGGTSPGGMFLPPAGGRSPIISPRRGHCDPPAEHASVGWRAGRPHDAARLEVWRLHLLAHLRHTTGLWRRFVTTTVVEDTAKRGPTGDRVCPPCRGTARRAIRCLETARVPQSAAAQVVGHERAGITFGTYNPEGTAGFAFVPDCRRSPKLLL